MARYQFIVSGTPPTSSPTPSPNSSWRRCPTWGGMSLHGERRDQAAVRSVVARLDDLGLTLLEMRRIPA
jgi:hypothetical protein